MSGPVIIYRLGSLGDTIVALPCFHKIANVYQDRERIVLTNNPVAAIAPALEAIVGGSGLIDRVIAYDVGERSRINLLRLLLKIRGTGAQTMVYLAAGRGLENVARDLKFFRLCGIREFIGAPVTPELHDSLMGPVEGEYEPEAERLARTLAPLGDIDMRDRTNWDLLLTKEEHGVAGRALAPLEGQPFLAISTGTKLPANDWGKENWSALLTILTDKFGHLALVGIGTNADFASIERLLRRWKSKTVNLCGPLTPRQSAAVLGRAALFIGHDSGPMHLAAAAGAPTIGLFGNNNKPRRWHPYGERCEAIHDMSGVSNISVEQVVERVAQQLGYAHV